MILQYPYDCGASWLQILNECQTWVYAAKLSELLCCFISPCRSEAGSDHKGQTPYPITIPKIVNKSSTEAKKVLLLFQW